MVASTFHVGVGPSDKYDRFHMFMAGALFVGFIRPMDQIMSFLLISRRAIFEFRVNQKLTKGHMDFSVLSLDSSSRKTWV